MTYSPSQTEDPTLALSMGIVEGRTPENRFGLSTDVDAATDTDLWDRANATDSQPIWLAPTAPRIHQISSSSGGDADGLAGARTVLIRGLSAWDSKPTSEIVTLNGTTNVPTVNAYVIIDFMSCLTFGVVGTNSGRILATADTDGTVTAQINVANFDTNMAILGVSSLKDAYVTGFDSSEIKSGAISAVLTSVALYANTSPDVNTTSWRKKDVFGLSSDGSNYVPKRFDPYMVIPGPAMIRLTANASAANIDVSGSMGVYLVDK